MARKKAVTLSAAVEHFVAELRLSGAEQVLAALAGSLAESFDDAPPYARARLAAELREIVAELDAADAVDLREPRARRLLRGVELA